MQTIYKFGPYTDKLIRKHWRGLSGFLWAFADKAVQAFEMQAIISVLYPKRSRAR
jgi:hypothetical protein